MISLGLVAALLWLGVPRAQAATGDGESGEQHASLCGLIIGCTVLITGGYIVYELAKLCQRKFPETPPPPPPPPANTNQPPVIPTNRPPATVTNRVMALQLNPADTTAYDIAAYGFTAPDGSTYHTLSTTALATSPDLRQWKARCVRIYSSSTVALIQVDEEPPVLQPVGSACGIDLGLANGECGFVRSLTR